MSEKFKEKKDKDKKKKSLLNIDKTLEECLEESKKAKKRFHDYRRDLDNPESMTRYIEQLTRNGNFIRRGEILYGYCRDEYWKAIPDWQKFFEFIIKNYGKIEKKYAEELYLTACARAFEYRKDEKSYTKHMHIPFDDGDYIVGKRKIAPIDFEKMSIYRLKFGIEQVVAAKPSKKLVDFLDGITGGDKLLKKRLRTALCFSLLDREYFKAFFILGGAGGSRGVLFRLLDSVFPCSAVSNVSLNDMEQNARLTHVIGKKVILCADESGTVLNNRSIITRLLCGSGINTDRKYQTSVDFCNTATLYFGGDYLPGTKKHGTADLADNLEIVRLEPYYECKPEDINAILNDTKGFLHWLLKGAVWAAEHDYVMPVDKAATVSSYKTAYSDFVNKCLIRFDDARTTSAEITEAFCKYKKLKIDACDRHLLNGMIRNKFPNTYRSSMRCGEKNTSGYLGVTFRERAEIYECLEHEDEGAEEVPEEKEAV